MSAREIKEFLGQSRHTILATKSASGAPQLSPVWYVYDDGVMYISTSDTSVKVRNLRRDPAITVCVDGCRGDSRYVVLTGKASFIDNGEPEQLDMRWRIIRHYHDGEAEARDYYLSTQDDSQVIIVLKPDRTISQDFN